MGSDSGRQKVSKPEGEGSRDWRRRARPHSNGRSGREASGSAHRPAALRPGSIGLTRIEGDDQSFELVHPWSVDEVELDYREGMELWKAGDPEGARDALRFALQ